MNASDLAKVWQNIEKTAQKAGLRDGIFDGRASNFQSSFDKGLRYGFFSGYGMGSYKGALIVKDILQEDKTLDNPRAGWCQLCTSKNVESVSEGVERQMDETNKNLEHLKKTYFEQVGVEVGDRPIN